MYFLNILSLIILLYRGGCNFSALFVSIDRWKRKEPAYETTKAEENFWKKILFMNIAFLLIVVLIFTLFHITPASTMKENIHRMLEELSGK